MRYLGHDVWGIYSNAHYTGKFIRLYVELAEVHSSSQSNGYSSAYNGCQLNLVLEITSEKLQDLKNQEEKLTVMKYTSLNSEPITEIKLKLENGIYKIPVVLNHMLTIDFVLDLGASDVFVSPDIFSVLLKAGTIDDLDFIGSQTYQLADGSTAKSSVFNIKTLLIGDKEIKNVRTSVSNSLSSPLLLGQSALRKLNSYRIDNSQHLLIID
jgi:predicted aspartyl protease